MILNFLDILIFGDLYYYNCVFYQNYYAKILTLYQWDIFIVGILLSILIYNRFNLYHQDGIYAISLKLWIFQHQTYWLINLSIINLFVFTNLCRYTRVSNCINNINLRKQSFASSDPINNIDDDKLDYDPICPIGWVIFYWMAHTKSISIS
jgi:hypothetical protein